MEKVGVPDYPMRHEKWKQEQLADEMWKIEVAKAVQEKMKAEGIEPPPDQGPGQGQGGGRKPTGAKPHHPEQKGSKSGNVRTVNSTS